MMQKSFLTTHLWNPRGITLVELIVVVAVLGILASTLTLNLISRMPKYRLNGATRQIVWDLIAARAQAISRNRNSQVFFLPETQSNCGCDDTVDDNGDTVDNCEGDPRYSICYDADNNGNVNGVTVDDNGDIVDNCEGNGPTKDIQRDYSDVTITSNRNPIFSPNGTVGNTPTITVRNPAGCESITISIAGRISIKSN